MLFSTQTLRSIIAGDSPIDLPALALRCRDDALRFLEAYGLRMADERDARRARRFRAQAIAILEARILRGSETIPTAVRELEDLPQLLLWASNVAQAGSLSRSRVPRRRAVQDHGIPTISVFRSAAAVSYLCHAVAQALKLFHFLDTCYGLRYSSLQGAPPIFFRGFSQWLTTVLEPFYISPENRF